MAVFYTEGEQKIRPGVYQRHVNADRTVASDAQDGICAIPVQANWGPLNKVVRNTNALQLERNYGSGTYGEGYTVPAAAAMFAGGAATVLTYRLGGTDGKAAAYNLAQDVTVTAKYPGTMPISVSVQTKLGYNAVKVFSVYAGTTLVENFEFEASTSSESPTTNETNNLVAATAESNYVTVAVTQGAEAPAIISAVDAAQGTLTGGKNPTVTNENYSAAFAALEPFYYNTIALDVDDDSDLTLSLMLQAYLDNAYKYGKLGMAVVGEKTTVDFQNRLEHAKSFNDSKVVYLGGGFMAGTTNKDGVLGICQTAGVIASTPSNKGIPHSVIADATDLCESLTYSQYEDAILAGMLMVSMSPDGSIWYDSGINTLTVLDDTIQDAGWKKIRRVKVRYELIDRLDRALAPKAGRVSADSDGISDIIQAGQRVLDVMASNEGKLQPGATFKEDPDNPMSTDSAWFIINADDVDSLEKIYLQYQFKYSQNA